MPSRQEKFRRLKGAWNIFAPALLTGQRIPQEMKNGASGVSYSAMALERYARHFNRFRRPEAQFAPIPECGSRSLSARLTADARLSSLNLRRMLALGRAKLTRSMSLEAMAAFHPEPLF